MMHKLHTAQRLELRNRTDLDLRNRLSLARWAYNYHIAGGHNLQDLRTADQLIAHRALEWKRKHARKGARKIKRLRKALNQYNARMRETRARRFLNQAH